MEEPKPVVISYHDGKDRYARGQKRLLDSLIKHWDGPYRMYNPSNSNFRSHMDNPYAFKIDAFNKAREDGFNQILYVDCSIWAIKDVSPLFDVLSDRGYVMQYAGHMCGTWTNDATLYYFDIDRDTAMTIPMFSAGFLALDFSHPVTHNFFVRWEAACNQGLFMGRWDNKLKTESNDHRCEGHRHDMSCASIIANDEKMHIDQCGDWFAYIGPAYNSPPEKSIFYAQGL